VVISYLRFGTSHRSHVQGSRIICPPENGTDRMSRNVGNKSPQLAA